MNDFSRTSIALLLPFVACLIQWLLWPFINPFVWFLFFPTVFCSAWIGSLFGGIASAIISALLVWYVFIPPQFSWVVDNINNIYSVVMFVGMGSLFGLVFSRLERAQRQLQDSNKKISDLYEKTKEMDILKTQFFANISHELRTPLALILGPAQKHLHDNSLESHLRTDLEMIERNASQLQRHVNELLDFAKLDAGKMSLSYVQINLAGHVRMLASHFTNLAHERGIAFTVTAPDALDAQVDPDKFHRIILNILSNAFKFTPEDGRISIELRSQGKTVHLRVSDTGPGIPDAKKSIIFEPFRQLDGGSDRTFGGTGLGLSIAKEFTELHGGSITVTNNTAGGAEFTVSIPLIAPEWISVSQEIHSEKIPLHQSSILQIVRELHPSVKHQQVAGEHSDKPLVLVVEDNQDMNRFICSILQNRFNIISAFSGEEGVEAARQTRPDLIVSDIMMPGMSGEVMVAELRKIEELQDVPVIILTAKADDELQIKMLSDGVQDYLRKPFLPDELLARADGLVSERRSAAYKLHISEARYQELFEQMTAGFALHEMIFDEEGNPKDYRFLTVNPAFEQLTGTKAVNIVGRTVLEVMPGIEEQWIETFATVVRTGKPVSFESYTASLRKHYRVWAYPQRPGQFAIILDDITGRVLAEDALKQSELRFKTLVKASPTGVFQTDASGKCIYVNERWCEIAGLSSEQALGNGWQSALHPDDSQKISDAWYKSKVDPLVKTNIP